VLASGLPTVANEPFQLSFAPPWLKPLATPLAAGGCDIGIQLYVYISFF